MAHGLDPLASKLSGIEFAAFPTALEVNSCSPQFLRRCERTCRLSPPIALPLCATTHSLTLPFPPIGTPHILCVYICSHMPTRASLSRSLPKQPCSDCKQPKVVMLVCCQAPDKELRCVHVPCRCYTFVVFPHRSFVSLVDTAQPSTGRQEIGNFRFANEQQ